MKKQKHIVVAVTGSIAAYRSADIVRELLQKGFKVSVVMTKEAEHFITPLTLSSLSGGQCFSSMFGESSYKEMPHIKLAQEADLVLIAPATANVIGKMANGLADDLVTCIVLATQAKILVAPAMNTNMYHNKFVQENISKLKKSGFKFIDVIKGELACGTYGDGHIAETKDIIKVVCQLLGL